MRGCDVLCAAGAVETLNALVASSARDVHFFRLDPRVGEQPVSSHPLVSPCSWSVQQRYIIVAYLYT